MQVQERLISRRVLFRYARDFIAYTTVVTAAAYGAGYGLASGLRRGIEDGPPEIPKSYGMFKVIYERSHIRGTSIEEIPDDINVLFREFPLSFSTSSPIPVLRNLDRATFRKGVLEKMARQGGKIAFGDIDIPDDFHPFSAFWNALVEFRNVVMADKALTTAAFYFREEGIVPKVGVNVGSGHFGIEDYLKEGNKFCIDTISGNYPKEFLKPIIEANGGITDFCSTRVIELPRDFKITDLDDAERSKKITDKKITDIGLEEALNTKLNS